MANDVDGLKEGCMFSLRAKVTILAIGAVWTSILCSSLYTQYVVRDYLRDFAFQAQNTAIHAIARHIGEYVSVHAAVIAVSATLPQVRDVSVFPKAAEEYRGAPESAGMRQREYFREILQVHPEFNNLTIYSPDQARPVISEPFQHQLGTPLKNYQEGFATRDWYRGVTAGGFRQVYVSEAYVNAQRQLLAAIVTRIYGEDKRVVGILAGNLKLERLNEYIQSFSYGKTTKTYVVDATGNLLAHSDPSLLGMSQLTRMGDREIVRQAVGNITVGEGSRVYANPSTGETLYASYVKIPQADWYVIAEQSETEVLAKTERLHNGILFVAIFLSLTALLMIPKLIKKTIRPVYEMIALLEALGRGDFTSRLSTALLNRRDEIGQAAKAVDMMQIRRQAAEMELDAGNEELQTLNAELGAVETRLRIQNDELQREIAERLRVDAALAESEERYLAVIEQSPEAVMFFDPVTAKIVKVNEQFTAQFGYDLKHAPFLSVYEIVVDSPENVKSFLSLLLRVGTLPTQRRLFRHRNGCLVHVERSGILIRYCGHLLGAIYLRDVSDDVRREQELQRDAQMATRVQLEMLSSPQSSEYIGVQTVYQPYSYVGGDLFFMDWRYEGQVLRGYLVDTAGHGLATALHTSAIHVLLREVNELDLPLSEQMRWLNRRSSQYFKEEAFAGAIAFEIDLQTRELRWVCAGIPGFWMSTQERQGIVEKPGMYLGMLEEENFEMHVMPISAGDAFYFMTDGLTDRIGRRMDLPLHNYLEMVSFVQALTVGPDQRDDATAICIFIRAIPNLLLRRQGWPRVLLFNGYGDYRRFKGQVCEVIAEATGHPHSMQEVAVNEALANALECRDGNPRQHQARLKFNRVGGWFIVRVKTSRIGFAGNAILRRLRSHPGEIFSYGEEAEMGRGIPIMLSVTQRLMYNSEGTEVLLAWKLA